MQLLHLEIWRSDAVVSCKYWQLLEDDVQLNEHMALLTAALAFIRILFVIIQSKVTNINHPPATRIFSSISLSSSSSSHFYSPRIVLSAINNLRDTTGFIVDKLLQFSDFLRRDLWSLLRRINIQLQSHPMTSKMNNSWSSQLDEDKFFGYPIFPLIKRMNIH